MDFLPFLWLLNNLAVCADLTPVVDIDLFNLYPFIAAIPFRQVDDLPNQRSEGTSHQALTTRDLIIPLAGTQTISVEHIAEDKREAFFNFLLLLEDLGIDRNTPKQDHPPLLRILVVLFIPHSTSPFKTAQFPARPLPVPTQCSRENGETNSTTPRSAGRRREMEYHAASPVTLLGGVTLPPYQVPTLYLRAYPPFSSSHSHSPCFLLPLLLSQPAGYPEVLLREISTLATSITKCQVHIVETRRSVGFPVGTPALLTFIFRTEMYHDLQIHHLLY